MKFCHNIGDPSYFPTPLPDCLCDVSFSRYSPKSSKNRTNVKVFGPQFFSGETTPTFLRHVASATYRPAFDKVWLSSVADLRQRSLAMKWNAECTEGG